MRVVEGGVDSSGIKVEMKYAPARNSVLTFASYEVYWNWRPVLDHRRERGGRTNPAKLRFGGILNVEETTMMDEDTYYDDLAQAQEDWATMVDAVSNRGIDGSFP